MSCHLTIHGQSALGKRRMPLLATSLVLVLSLAAAQPLAAQTVNVNAPGSLTTATGTTTPADGAVWNLNSTGIFLNTQVTLPANGTLTINGNGNTLNLNDGVTYGRFFNSVGPVTLSLSDVTLSTGNQSAVGANGGAISVGTNTAVASSLTVNASGTIKLVDNSAASTGGAIFATGAVSIGNADSIVTLSGNSAGAAGGAIEGVRGVTIDGSTITLTNNAALNGIGGAVAGGDITIGNASSTVTLTGNSAGFNNGGGAISSTGSVTINGNMITLADNVAPNGGAGGISAGNALTINAGTITATGNFGKALTSSGVMTINGSTITFTGNSVGDRNSGGALSAPAVTINGGTITFTGNTADGTGGAMNAIDVTLNGSAITVAGNTAVRAFGGAVSTLNFTLNATGPSQFSNNTAGTEGGAIWANGDLTLNAIGGDTIFRGNVENTAATPQANAIYLNNATGNATATFNAAAGSSITFFDPIQSNAVAGLVTVQKTGAGTVAFDGSLYTNPVDRLSLIYADTMVQEGTFAVRNNAVYGVLAADVGETTPSSFTVDSGAILAGGIAGEVRADDFALNGTLNIAGSAPPGSASGGFSTFTVTSNNVSFGAGSQVLFNTYLNDASVQRSDLLTLNLNGSATSGTADIRVTNVGGPGGLTTGNGIELVQANNGTTAGAFTLANPELRAGAFDYRLFQGGPDGSDPNNWYLRSTFMEGPTPPPTPGPGTFPIMGPEIATYGVVQPMAQQLGRAMLGTHDDRLGDLYPVQPCEPMLPIYTKAPPVYTKAPATDCGTDGFRPAVWGRVFGQQIDNHYQALADPRTDGQIAGLQVGFDVVRSDSLMPGHTDYAGLFAAYGNANVDVSGLVTNTAATAYVLQHTGHLNLNAYSGGAYWTHYGVPGWYLDLTLQGSSYGGGASTEFAHLNTSGSGLISSLEGGYPIALPLFGPGFVLEPQAQVLWQWVSFDSGNDGLGPVALGTTSETTARVGLKGKWTITTDSGQVWQPYVRANYWSDFGGNAMTMFGVDSVPLISHAQYMDVDAGFTTKINTHLSAFADAGYQFAVSNDGGGKRNGIKGTAGLRYQW